MEENEDVLRKIMENKRNVCLTTMTKGNTQTKEKPIISRKQEK